MGHFFWGEEGEGSVAEQYVINANSGFKRNQPFCNCWNKAAYAGNTHTGGIWGTSLVDMIG